MSGQQNFEPEVKKFRWLLQQGYITPTEISFYSNFYNIELTTVVSFQGHDILAPLFILSRPGKFDQIRRELPQAEIADPISKKFPIISLISLEKFINSLANRKIPFYFFTVWLHKSYYNAPQVHALLHTLLQLANNSNKYVIKHYNIIPVELPVSSDLQKIVCHFKKMLGEDSYCNDNDWWKYNLWGNRNTTSVGSITVDRKLIEKVALQYNISPICVHYVLTYNKNVCGLSSDVINKIKSQLSSS